ncbi:MAG TPA: HAMP domain-containing sensor histidine kinase [Planctomycetaceae bacterium]|nr:HAMP domain-containing sensor histidine kinase [Planctomycetaceae bacterium]
MINEPLKRLAALIEAEREELLTRWRAEVRQLPCAKHLDLPTLNDHIPALLHELAAAFRALSEQSIPEALREGSPPAHGLQRVEDGFDIEEVVAEYNILRACLHDLADQHGLTLQGKPFHILNRILDGAIGGAVQSFAAQQALEVQRRREEYLAFVAHDLRTPLNAISLAAKVLELSVSQGVGSGDTSQMFYTLRRNVQHLEGLVRKILEENSNLQTELGVKLQARTIDLWPLVEALIHDLHPVAGTASTRLVNNIPVDLVACADASLLRRVFQNLIANAIHYTPRGEVVIGGRSLDAEFAVECWVSDNGAGISPDLLLKVFEKGESNPEDEGGMGLGLAIVKTFVEAHGGEVAVESQEGAGSKFRFTLPNQATVSANSQSGAPHGA